jgi:hypothetical protein
MKKFATLITGLAVLVLAQFSIAEPLLTMYKTPNCGCCVDWAEYLRKEGFEVRVMDRHDLAPIKQAAGVKPEMASCHTALIDGYVIEGHVPAGPIRKLLAERPATRGLAVPGMPLNSPGMGPMDGKLKTYTLEGKVYSVD